MADFEDAQTQDNTRGGLCPLNAVSAIRDNWNEFNAIYKQFSPTTKADVRQKFTEVDHDFAEALIGENDDADGEIDEAETAFGSIVQPSQLVFCNLLKELPGYKEWEEKTVFPST